MKHKLLFALAGALMSMSAMAYDEPAKVEPAYSTEWATPTNGGVYFLYNVGADQYLGAGNNWGTHVVTATVSEESTTQLFFWDAGIALSGGQNQMNVCCGVLPIILTENEDGTFYIQHLGSNRGDRYLTSEDGNSWIDGGIGRASTFNIVAVSGGYTIQATNTVDAGTYFGAQDPETEPEEYEEVVRNVMNNLTTEDNIVWRFAPTNYVQCLAYEARVILYDLLLEADEYGVDNSAALAVYENDAATKEQIEAATEALKPAVNRAKFAQQFVGTEDNPQDVTELCLVNPDFEIATSNGVLPPGWDITITGQNCGQMNRTDTNPNTGFAFTNFIEAWHPSSLGDGVIAQTVYGLPKGKYVLECDASACHDPANGDGSDIVGVNLFIEAGSNKVTTRVGTARLGIQHFAVTFVNEESDALTFGLEAIATNANWLSADNFKITYYGETAKSQAYLSLETAIEEGQTIEDNLVGNDIEDASIVNVEASVASNFSEKFAAAQAALGGSDEEMTAAEAELKAAIEEVNKSNTLYQKFQEVYNNALLAAQNFKDNNNQWPDLQDEINDYAEVDLAEAFNAGTLTEDDLEEAQGKVDALIAAYLSDPDKIQPGDDLTALIVNADFSQGSGATNIPGWTINSGSITELSAAYHNIEAYHKAFDFSQTIKNLPAGSYQITVQGFVAVESSENDMVLYAGVSEKKFMEINDEYSEHAILSDGTDDEGNPTSSGGWPYDRNPEAGHYTPNSMQGAGMYFETTNPATGKPFYLNTVTIAHAGGDLTIGVKCNATGLWILWDNFTLKYLGSDNLIPLLEEIEEKGIELEDIATSGYMTDKAEELVADLQAKIEAADDITSSDDALALISEIKDAIEYIKEGQKLADELTPLVEDYETMANEQNIDDAAFLALLENLAAKVAEEETFADNEEIAKGIEDIKKGWVAAVVNAAEEGDELKGIILNADFETGNLSGWTDTFTAGNHGFQNNATYADADGETKISNFAESWNNTNFVVDGEISQNIGVLPEGWYQLEVDGYAVNQSQAGGEPEEGVHGVDLFAKTGESVAKQSIGIGGENGVSQHWTLGFYSDGVNETVIGVVAEGANCNWTAFDNFILKYFGETQPVAVEGIAAETSAAPKAIYTLDGRQASTLRRGINIVRKADGSVQKVLVK